MKQKANFRFLLSLLLVATLGAGSVYSRPAHSEGREMDLKYAEDELAKAEAEFHEQLKKMKDPSPTAIDRLKKEILEPKREALRKVMGHGSKPDSSTMQDDPAPRPKGMAPAEGAALDGSKVEKAMSFPGKKKPGSDLRSPSPKAVQFKEESSAGSYGSDQIEFANPKKSK